MTARLLALAVILAAAFAPRLARGQEPVVLRGNWTATAGARVFHGQWSAQIVEGRPDEAIGSWTLLEAGRVVLQGTWSARKQPRAWRGSWSARIATGPPFSGTWAADPAGLTGKTFQDMLAQSATAEIKGTWRRGRARGNWWLR